MKDSKRGIDPVTAAQSAEVDRDAFALALRTVLIPVSQHLGTVMADCALYASAGAEALRHLALPASVQAGDALWRVGPGDVDVIHHAATDDTATYTLGPACVPDLCHPMAFHAWICIAANGSENEQLVDFTTWQLRDKALLLDQLDGKTTQVQFCPPYLWLSQNLARARTRSDVVGSYSAGIFSYRSRPELCRQADMASPIVEKLAIQALSVYAALVGTRSPANPAVGPASPVRQL